MCRVAGPFLNRLSPQRADTALCRRHPCNAWRGKWQGARGERHKQGRTPQPPPLFPPSLLLFFYTSSFSARLSRWARRKSKTSEGGGDMVRVSAQGKRKGRRRGNGGRMERERAGRCSAWAAQRRKKKVRLVCVFFFIPACVLHTPMRERIPVLFAAPPMNLTNGEENGHARVSPARSVPNKERQRRRRRLLLSLSLVRRSFSHRASHPPILSFSRIHLARTQQVPRKTKKR